MDEHRDAARQRHLQRRDRIRLAASRAADPGPRAREHDVRGVVSHDDRTFLGHAEHFAAAGVDAPPLHALADGVAGGNGVFIESGTSAFPTQSFLSSNYWVDVVFNTSVGGNNPPTISDINDKTTNEDTATPALSFTVGDAETPAASLTLTATSSNTTLVPAANIVFGGSGASRTVTITPAPNQAARPPSPSP